MSQPRLGPAVTVPAVIGFVTGLVTFLFQPFGGPLIDPIEELVWELNIGWIEGTVYLLLTLGPGFLYGAMLGYWLHRRLVHGWWRWAVLTLGATASWFFGVRVAIEVYDYADTEWVALMIGGAAGGLVGAVVFGAGAMLAYRATRNARFAVATIVIGTLAGMLLAVRTGENPLLVFPVWQAAIAVLLGWTLTRGGATAAAARQDSYL